MSKTKEESTIMQTIKTFTAPEAIGPYSQGKASHGFIFTSGQIPIDPADGTIHAVTIEEQTEQACINVGEILKAAGVSFDNVVKTTCFLADMNDFPKFNAVYEKYFTSLPARSCVAVKTLPKGVLCEIEAIAEE